MVSCGVDNQALLAAGTLLWSLILKESNAPRCKPYWIRGRLAVADTAAGPVFIDQTPEEEMSFIAKCNPACPNNLKHGDKPRGCCRFQAN